MHYMCSYLFIEPLSDDLNENHKLYEITITRQLIKMGVTSKKGLLQRQIVVFMGGEYCSTCALWSGPVWCNRMMQPRLFCTPGRTAVRSQRGGGGYRYMIGTEADSHIISAKPKVLLQPCATRYTSLVKPHSCIATLISMRHNSFNLVGKN